MIQKIKETIHTLNLYKDIYLTSTDIIKVHGTLRVGTNYLTKLIQANFRGRILSSEELGWKHGGMKYSSKVKGSSLKRVGKQVE